MSTFKKNISVIIPTYNEEATVSGCLRSLLFQSLLPREILIVDDGSTDNTVTVVNNLASEKSFGKTKMSLLRQKHLGPGQARNLGALNSHGSILVFVDADMTFDEDFIKELTSPIIRNIAIATNSKEEKLANPDNFWAKCWNMGRFASAGIFTKSYNTTMIPDRSNFGTIYRAIRKDVFSRAGGFETTGDYQDDESLFKKIGIRASIVKAVFYHANPASAKEVWSRAYWIGSSPSFIGKHNTVKFAVKFSPPFSLAKGVIIALRFGYLPFILFKIVYDSAIFMSILNRL